MTVLERAIHGLRGMAAELLAWLERAPGFAELTDAVRSLLERAF